MNQVTIGGHLGADPEVRFTSSNQKVTTMRVAARTRRSKEEDTIWWRITIWGEQFDKIIPYFKKGSPIIVMGELSKPEIFTDREGRPGVSMNITANNILFSPFGRADGASSSSEGRENKREAASDMGSGSDQPSYGQGKEDPAFVEDEIPF